MSPIDPEAWKITGLIEELAEQTIRETQAEIVDAEKLFFGKN